MMNSLINFVVVSSVRSYVPKNYINYSLFDYLGACSSGPAALNVLSGSHPSYQVRFKTLGPVCNVLSRIEVLNQRLAWLYVEI
jgi:hypothetical protein